MNTATTKKLLTAAAGLPVPEARRVVEALASQIQDGKSQDSREEQDMQDLRTALAADLQPLGDALWSAYQLGDWAACQAALRKISKGMPGMLNGTDHLSEVITRQLTAALTEDPAALEAKGTSDGVRKGWETRRRRGWKREPKGKPKRDNFGPLAAVGMSQDDAEERLENLIDLATRQEKSLHNAAWRKDLGWIDLPWGNTGDKKNDFKGGHGLSHVLAKHRSRDASKLPWVLAHGEISQSGHAPEKREVRLGGFVAVMIQDKPSRSWLLTGFTKNK